ERWTGFLNGVLRNVERMLTDQVQTEPSAGSVPISDGRYRQLARDAFPDPTSDPTGYFADAFSFPRWLASRWQPRFDLAELCRIGFWFDPAVPLALRVNTLKIGRDELIVKLEQAEIDSVPGGLAESIRLHGTTRVDTLPGFAEGFFSVQDESA